MSTIMPEPTPNDPAAAALDLLTELPGIAGASAESGLLAVFQDIAAECHDVRVATVEGQVAGFCEGHFGSDFTAKGAPGHCPVPHAFVGFLAVQETHRRAGIGRALLLSYAADAKTHGCSFLALSPDESSDDAERLAFFQSLGLMMVDTRSRLWGAPIIDLL